MFITIFLIATALLYSYYLKNKEVEKRMNYYLDIENKYRQSKESEKGYSSVKVFLKNSNEYIRELFKKGLPGKDQKKISQQLVAAGVNLKPEEYVMARLFFAFTIGGVFFLFFNTAFMIPFGLILGYYLPQMWLGSKRKKRVRMFNDGLADMIAIIVGSLKAGYSFSQALKTVSEESGSPIREEIQTLLNELNYGISMEDALANLKKRMPSVDLEIMIHAILIQRQIGGNLSVILETIINTIRERKKLERHVRTLTAQGRMSGRILAALPVFIAVVMFAFNRTMLMDFAMNKYGQIAIAVGIVSCLLGFVVIRKITEVEV
jgi:tight adherence protein B